jgi:hypothetical protein
LNNPNLSDVKKNALLAMAGKKLGQDPEALKQQIEAGQMESILSKMDPKAKAQMMSFLGDQKKMEALLSDDKVKTLLASLSGGQK